MTGGSLREALRWKSVLVGCGAAHGTVALQLGSAGKAHPHVLITAGIHGDEGPWGALAIAMLLESVPSRDLLGSVTVVPACNPLAMEADARCAPLDSLDLNRVFPGDPGGSHTQRLAGALVEHAVAGADVVVDLHGGGSWCVNAFAFSFPGCEDLAEAVGAPFLVTRESSRSVSHPSRHLGSRSRAGSAGSAGGAGAGRAGMPLSDYALSRGARVVAIEIGGRCPAENEWASRVAAGMRRVMQVAGVVARVDDDRPAMAPASAAPTASIHLGHSEVLRPSRGGVFLPEMRHEQAGRLVPAGTVLGRMVDPITLDTFQTFVAPFQPTALMLLRPAMAVLEAGAMTYVVGRVREESSPSPGTPSTPLPAGP
ncbi:MAG: M14 family metallopeptidase [Bacillota bacterium]|nr:M14 family metallopeptidase [Bacillota bacterium]